MEVRRVVARCALRRRPGGLMTAAHRGVARFLATRPDPLLTKIVCTLGPASSTAATVEQLVGLGLTCARLNMSHVGASYDEPLEKLGLVRNARDPEIGGTGGPANLRGASSTNFSLPGVLVDTKGPEVRTGSLPGDVDVIEIQEGWEVVLTFEDVTGDAPPKAGATGCRLHVDYAALPKTVSVGSKVSMDDGLLQMTVVAVTDRDVTALAENSGPIKKRKGVNLPGSVLDLPALTDKDKADLGWAVEQGADFVAASFVRSASNARACVAYLERCATVTGTPRPLVISKIENAEGVDHFAEILEASDGIMVARGDLGVEIDYAKVFAAQRMMVALCNAAGKPVIVATQMLDSMQKNPRPTRAEVTDVAAAVLDGADAVMLSGETAAGKYPLKALEAMTAIVREAELIKQTEEPYKLFQLPARADMRDVELNAAARSAVITATHLDAKLITCITMTGSVARAIARHRPNKCVLAFCHDPAVARRLQLYRGIHPILLPNLSSANNPYAAGTRMGLLRTETIRTAKELGYIKAGDLVVSLDRNTGKPTDSFTIGTTLKVFTAN